MAEKSRTEWNRVIKAGTLVLQVSLSAVCPIILLLSLGIWLDGRYNPGSHVFAVIGIVCGVYSAYRSTWYLIRDTMRLGKDEKEEKPHEQ